MQLHLLRRLPVALAAWLVATAAFADESNWSDRSNLNIRPGVNQISHDVMALNNFALWVVSLIGLLVVALVFWAMIRHRRSVRPEPATFHESLFFEITWTVIPVFI